MRQKKVVHDCTCIQCGKTFRAKRFDARLCSATCRTRARRAKLRADALKNQLPANDVRGIAKAMPKTYQQFDAFIERLALDLDAELMNQVGKDHVSRVMQLCISAFTEGRNYAAVRATA